MHRLLYLFAFAPLLAGCDNSVKTSAESTQPVKPLPGFAGIGSDRQVKLTGDNCKITFVGTKSDGKHDGGFKKMSGTLTVFHMSPGMKIDESKGRLENISVEIEADSLFSDADKLTEHLKNQDFFNVKEHPKITFKSTKISAEGGKSENMKITGDMTMLGVTKPVTFNAVCDTTKGFYMTSEFKISRKEFGMKYGEGKVDDLVSVKVVVGMSPEEIKAASGSK